MAGLQSIIGIHELEIRNKKQSRVILRQFVGDVQEEEENFPLHPPWTLVRTSEQRSLRQEKGEEDEEAGGVFALPGPAFTDVNPIIKESFAKQLLSSKRQERPMKAGHPDEPMR
ncbi:uncharacterized protein C17orf67 homolog [Anarhichas minor]|uniref:uncharacterized protein C17orf67 homolog n=1 Tax=Anarhichas minor TaxID=65739 RepID=UPI003F741088